MQILGLLGMYFDAMVVEVKNFLFLFQIGSGHTVYAIYFEITRLIFLTVLVEWSF